MVVPHTRLEASSNSLASGESSGSRPIDWRSSAAEIHNLVRGVAPPYPGAFTRARFRMAIPIDDVMVSRTSYQVFWRTDMLLGTRLTSALEWPVTPSSALTPGVTPSLCASCHYGTGAYQGVPGFSDARTTELS